MKLLIITNVYWPDRGGGAAVFTDFAEGLASAGHEVEVHCAVPYYPEWADKSGQNGFRRHRERANGVNIVRHGIYIPKNPARLAYRAVYELSFFVSLLRSRSVGADVVIAFTPLYSSAVVGLLTKWRLRCPLWVNVQDIQALASVATGIAPARIGRIVHALHHFVFARADLLTSIAPGMVAELAATSDNANAKLYPNWVNRSVLERADSLRREADEIEASTRPSFVYAGNLGEKQWMTKLLDGLVQTDADFRFQIFGAGSQYAALETQIASLCDGRITLSGFLEEDEFLRQVAEADFFLMPEAPGSGASYLPSKSKVVTSCGTPTIVISDDASPIAAALTEPGWGIRVDWADVQSIPARATAMLTSSDGTRLRHQCLAYDAGADRDEAILLAERLLQELSGPLER